MKKILISSLLIFSASTLAYVNDYEVVSTANKFMASKCKNFNTMDAESIELNSKQFIVKYTQGWANVGIDERPPHDDSGKTADNIVVFKYSCR